jgi:hypothetical protein
MAETQGESERGALLARMAQYAHEHVDDFIREAPDPTKLAIVGKAIAGHAPTFAGSTREALLTMLAEIAGPAAVACAKTIRAKAANEIPMLFILHVPGQGTSVVTGSAVYMGPGGEA